MLPQTLSGPAAQGQSHCCCPGTALVYSRAGGWLPCALPGISPNTDTWLLPQKQTQCPETQTQLLPLAWTYTASPEHGAPASFSLRPHWSARHADVLQHWSNAGLGRGKTGHECCCCGVWPTLGSSGQCQNLQGSGAFPVPRCWQMGITGMPSTCLRFVGSSRAQGLSPRGCPPQQCHCQQNPARALGALGAAPHGRCSGLCGPTPRTLMTSVGPVPLRVLHDFDSRAVPTRCLVIAHSPRHSAGRAGGQAGDTPGVRAGSGQGRDGKGGARAG